MTLAGVAAANTVPGNSGKEERRIYFAAGIPGLPPEIKEFVLTRPGPDLPFYLLQCRQEELNFILINPFDFFPDYEFELDDEEAKKIGVSSPDQVAIFNIVNAREGIKKATVNLLAPIVINIHTGQARQVILSDRRYNIRHPLFSPAGDVVR